MEKFKKVKVLELSNKEDFKKVSKIKITDGKFDVRHLPYGRYHIREPKKFEFDSFEVKEMLPITMKIVEKEEYFQGDSISISWNGRSELMYRIEIDGKNPINKLVQGNSYVYSVQNTENTKFKITEQKFERSAEKSINFTVSKDLDIIGLQEVEKNGKIYKVLKLRNPRKIKYGYKLVNQDGKVFKKQRLRSEEILINAAKPGLYTVLLIDIKRKVQYYKTEFTLIDSITNNQTKEVVYSEGSKFKINLKWKRQGTHPEKPEYTLRVYEADNSTEPIIEEKLTESNYEFVSDDPGTFQWQVSSNAPEQLNSSAIYPFSISRPVIGVLGTPKIILKYMEDGDCNQFIIPKNKYSKLYDVFMYSSKRKIKGSWKQVYHKRLKTNKDCIKSKGEGKYYYKYRIEDKWNRKTQFSEMGTIFFPISPLDNF